MANEVLVTDARWNDGLAFEISAGDQTWTIDGAGKRGPSPVEALLGSLAACLGVLVRAFAPGHEVTVQAVRVKVEGDFDADGYQGKADVRTGFSAIRFALEIDSTSPKHRVEALRTHVLASCPIKDTLTGVNVDAFEIDRAG